MRPKRPWKLIKRDAVEMTCREDTEMVISKAEEVVQTKGISEFEFRKKHRNGQIVWVHVQMKWIGEEDGCPLLLCVFHNITDLKEAQLEKEHLINSIPGGIASYRVEGERFIPEFYSDGVMMISGHTRMEYEEMVRRDAFDIIYEPDRKRVLDAAKTALISGEVLDVSYRMYHKDGNTDRGETGEKTMRYRFTVSDTGIGMPEEFLSQVFEPFSRSGNATRIEGTGLGLSITKGLVDLMEGKISVKSRLHEGSVFTVELEFDCAESENSLSQENMRQGFSLSAAEKALAGICFLAAEDNDINAEILCELLRLCGAETVLAADGVQAVQSFRDSKPNTFDAVLMDIQMPEMNGYDAARAIRNIDRSDAEEIPIIAMTANAFAEDVFRSREAGMNAHVAKPIDLEVLMDTLWKVMKAPNLGET